ncbi:MAG: hypothetical protein ABWZ40_14055 [Caulobacterales bacterium]
MIRNAALTLISLAFCALALWILSGGDASDRMVGAGCLLFFGGCALVGAALLISDWRKARGLVPPSADRPTLFRFDPWFHAAFGFAGWGMTAGSVLFALQEATLWIAAGPALILFGLGGGALLARALDRAPVLRIDADGVFDRRLMAAPAPWAKIKAVGFPSIGPVQHLELAVSNAPSYRKWRNGVFGWLGRSSLTADTIMIPFQGLDRPLAVALAAIGSHKPDILILADFSVEE